MLVDKTERFFGEMGSIEGDTKHMTDFSDMTPFSEGIISWHSFGTVSGQRQYLAQPTLALACGVIS